MPLTDAACRAAKPTSALRKLSDMGGLQLWVTPTGSRLWRLAYRFAGKQKLLSIGAYPDVSLLMAREARDDAKKLLAEGRDPSAAKKLSKLAGDRLDNTFRAIAQEYVAKLQREGRAVTTITKIEWLLGFAVPVLGTLKADTIRPIEVLAVLRKVEARGRYETARRLRSTIGSVFRYAIATARAESDPTLPLQGALTTPIVKSRAAIIEPAAVGALLRAIDDFDGQSTTRAALKLMALLFPRPGELRAAHWSEFDIKSAIWTIPAARTKMRRPHRVPLPRQALEELANLRTTLGVDGLVFPSVRTVKRPISENTLNAALLHGVASWRYAELDCAEKRSPPIRLIWNQSGPARRNGKPGWALIRGSIASAWRYLRSWSVQDDAPTAAVKCAVFQVAAVAIVNSIAIALIEPAL